MDIKELLEAHSKRNWEICIPHMSVDNVVFAYPDQQLCVLLLKLRGLEKWALPGGYIKKNEDIDDAVRRVLKERTNVDEPFLYQFATFGKTQRSESFFEGFDESLFHKQRFISTCYYALVDYTKVTLDPDEISDECAWMPIAELPDLIMDHDQIIRKALEVIREQLSHKPIGSSLLPEEFTLSEMKNLYETILGYKFNRGNFYRRIMTTNILTKLPKTRTGLAHKAPDLYRFDQEKYQNWLKQFGW